MKKCDFVCFDMNIFCMINECYFNNVTSVKFIIGNDCIILEIVHLYMKNA